MMFNFLGMHFVRKKEENYMKITAQKIQKL